MDERILQKIGLTNSEIKVYEALLELGRSSTGKITEKANIASSKIYEILEKLIDKGLVSYIYEGSIKKFEAAPPERILDYFEEKEKEMQEQKEQLKKILPELKLKQELQEKVSEASIFKGIKGVATAYEDVLQTMKKGEEYYVIGSIQTFEPYLRFIRKYHMRRAEAGIKVKILFSAQGKEWEKNLKGIPLTKIKITDTPFLTAAIIVVYKQKTMIITSTKNDITLFRIEDNDLADSFRNSFNEMWERPIQVFQGYEGLKSIVDLVHKEGKDIFLIGATGDLAKRHPQLFDHYNEGRIKKDIKIHALIVPEALKIKKYMSSPLANHWVLPKEFSSPNVIWIFGNYVINAAWSEDALLFVINNKIIADSYRNYFNMLKKVAKKI